jgi:TolB-like protein
MTSSTSSSARRAAGPLAAAILAAVSAIAVPVAVEAAPATPPGVAGRMRILALPPENLAAAPVPLAPLAAAIDRTVALAGAEVIGGAPVDEYLARYRIRYTGGVEKVATRAAKLDLGADAVLVTTVQLYSASPVRFGISMRLVAAGDEPSILWADGISRAGDESPGLFRLGIVSDLERLQAEVLGALGTSLQRYLAGEGPPVRACEDGGWFRPRIAYRARQDEREKMVIAVLPFVNLTNRRGAGEVVALEFARQLAASPGFKVLEPGSIREELLRRRIVMEDGVSVDQARTVLNAMEGDLVIAGYVFTYEDADVPASNFTAVVIDRKTGRIVWESTSYNQGNDSETVFGLRKVGTAPALTCRMVRVAIDTWTGRMAMPRRP